jgi:hypothetical protein
VKAKREKKALTFGGFITAAHDAWGKQPAREIVRLAVNARLVRFQGPQRFVFFQTESQPESRSYEPTP